MTVSNSIIRKKPSPNVAGLPDLGLIKDPSTRNALSAICSAIISQDARIPAPDDRATTSITFKVANGRTLQNKGRTVVYGNKITFEGKDLPRLSEEMPIGEFQAGTTTVSGGASTVTNTTVVTYAGIFLPFPGVAP